MKMKRLSLTAGVATLLLGSAIAPAFAATSGQLFTDVSTSTPHYTAMAYLKAHGVISGYPDGSFKPTQPISRVEALKLILIPQFKHWEKAQDVFLAGDSTPVSFKDTDKSQWYWQYIQDGYDNGIVNGYPDGTFKPASSVNTAENLKMLLTRYFEDDSTKLTDVPLTLMFSDEQGGAWYVKYLNEAGTMHVLDAGVSGNGFPGNTVSRAEFSEMVYRLMKMDDDGLDKFDESNTPAADLSTTGTASGSTSNGGMNTTTGGAGTSTFTSNGMKFTLPAGWTYDKTQTTENIDNITFSTQDATEGKVTVSVMIMPSFDQNDQSDETLLKTSASGAKVYSHTANNYQCQTSCFYLQNKGKLYNVTFGLPTVEATSMPSKIQISDDEALNMIASVK